MRYYIAVIVCVLCLLSCDRHSDHCGRLVEVERMIVDLPDSALLLLNDIDNDALSVKDRAKYALLLSMALDKNYIDKTDFDVLQPAIDYYKDNGTADERLQTCYYQGRIYQNQGNGDMAMRCFINAREIKGAVTDTLTLANLYVAQGSLFYSSYKIDEFIENNLDAATLYHAIDRVELETHCLLRALDGSIVKGNRALADSVMSLYEETIAVYPDAQAYIAPYILSYTITFGSNDDIKDVLDVVSQEPELSDETKIDLANGYFKTGDADRALRYIEDVHDESMRHSLKYLATKTDILEANGDFHGALAAYREYSSLLERMHVELFSQDLLFVGERHKLEMLAVKEANAKDRVLWISLCCAFVCAIVIGFLYYRYRIGRAKRILAENERAQLELERDKLALSAENLRLRIAQLESESANLKEVLQNQQELGKPVENAIKERIEILNSLLAKEITENDTYAKPYGEWIDSVVKDKNRFMDSTRLAFKATHPKFMEYLENCGLTEFEINYLCLYAIGLRGKEVGEYIQLKRHYNISSEIRKKLGIDEHETNIGIYVRKLMRSV